MRTAIILGGTGLIGRAAARRLTAAGWSVTVTGRDPRNMPEDLAAAGAGFKAVERNDPDALHRLAGSGADLLVDCLCFTADHAQQLVPVLADIGSTVMLSSKAVYADAHGNHVNSSASPHFPGPIREDNPTVRPGSGNFNSREGYGRNKVAAEQALLDSGHPVTVVRASKVHGDGAAPPREWVFVRRILDRRPAVFLAARGRGTDHTTAAANTAALIERLADVPGRRIVNSADPDAPNGLAIARAVAAYMGYSWQEILLDGTPGTPNAGTPNSGTSYAGTPLGAHPWNADYPLVLDTSASLRLGYRPVGSYAETVGSSIDWLVRTAAERRSDPGLNGFFSSYVDYAAEDSFLASA